MQDKIAMKYKEYFTKFNKNDSETVVQLIPNDDAISFLTENAPRLYCPDGVIEETFAFRTWTLRKHLISTEDGYLLTEFLVNSELPWAGKHNTINAPLLHHLNESRWFKFSDKLLDYISFFIKGEGSVYKSGSALAYHTPALSAMYEYCILTANEDYLTENAEHFENYFNEREARHLTGSGLYWSNDDREGTEFTISGRTQDKAMLRGFRPLMNSCMCADAYALGKIFALAGNSEKSRFYKEKADGIRKLINERLWDEDFYKAIHPEDGDLDRPADISTVPKECNVRELIGYIPFAFSIPEAGREGAFRYLKDPAVFLAKTGLTTAEISHERFLYYPERGCTWNGKVWPYATSYAINAVIRLLDDGYTGDAINEKDLYALIKQYAEMHYSVEDGRKVNFIDEVMMPFEYSWNVHDMAKAGLISPTGGIDRGKDYNHSTFVDLVLRGLCGVGTEGDELTVKPRISGIWKWFRIENLTYRKHSYSVYYDEDGSVFGRGTGVFIEKEN